MALTVGTDSYISVADAAAYCELAGLDSLGVDTAESSLKQATLALDRLYGARFIGLKEQLSQALAWPRRPTTAQVDSSQDWYVVDSFGNYRDFSGIPTEVKQATVELAVLIEAGTNPYVQPEPVVTTETVEVDVIKQSRSYQAGYRTDPLFKVTAVLAPLLATGYSIKLVR